MIPALVPRENLVPANALFNLTFTASQLLGFAILGPLLVKVIGVDSVFALTLAIFVVCALIVLSLPSPSIVRKMANGDQHPMLRLWLDVKEGLVFIAGDPVLMRAIAYLTIAATTFLMIAALGPEFMSKVIGLPTEDIVYVVLPAGLGVITGVVLVNRVLKIFARDKVVDIALTTAGLSLMGIALVDPIFNAIWIRGTHQTRWWSGLWLCSPQFSDSATRLCWFRPKPFFKSGPTSTCERASTRRSIPFPTRFPSYRFSSLRRWPTSLALLRCCWSLRFL